MKALEAIWRKKATSIRLSINPMITLKTASIRTEVTRNRKVRLEAESSVMSKSSLLLSKSIKPTIIVNNTAFSWPRSHLI